MYKSPIRLKTGDSVAIVAPSSPCLTDEVKIGIEIMIKYGLKPVLGPCVKNLLDHESHAGSVSQRAKELNWALTDPSIAAAWCVQGGIGCAAILPYLNYEAIEMSAKPFIGMSDITSINNALLAHCGLISYSGQGVAIRRDHGAEVQAADSLSLAHTIELLMSENEWNEAPFDINVYLPQTISPGKASGTIVGGNLETFVHLIGTPFMPDTKNCILFIEDVHKDGESVERLLLHLQMANVLDDVVGVVIGEFAEQPEETGIRVPSIEDVLGEYFSDGIPCIVGYSFSHGPQTIPIPIGAMCEMDANTGIIKFRHKLT